MSQLVISCYGQHDCCSLNIANWIHHPQIKDKVASLLALQKRISHALKGSTFYMGYMHTVFTQQKQYKQKSEVMR